MCVYIAIDIPKQKSSRVKVAAFFYILNDSS